MIRVWYSEQYSLVSHSDARKKSGKVRRVLSFVCLMVGLGLLVYFVLYTLTQAPQDFPHHDSITIETGMQVREIAGVLQEQSVIRSAFLFTTYMTVVYRDETLKAGTYEFAEAYALPRIIDQMIQGKYQPDVLRVTHPEGRTAEQLSRVLGETFSTFTAEEFLAVAKPYEGKLFPETYLLPPHYSATEVRDVFVLMYEDVMSEYRDAISEHSLSEDEIITLASIIEREANSEESMRMVSGILQNRLDIGMALQADATIGYVLDKPLSELLATDLEKDSPYNTYLYTGLTPTPIGNPGRQAIESVLNPLASNNLYYITGNDGNFYYAETFAEHRRNIVRYLQ